MKIKWITLLLLMWASSVIAQNNNSIELRKGAIFDILPLKFNKEADSLSVKRYLNEAILPRAIELGYIPIRTVLIEKGGVVQGNYTPDVIIFGGWKNRDSLDNIMNQLESEFSDFHSLRREIWTVFCNTHYELEEDLYFEFLPNKFYVATSYWIKETSSVDDLIKSTNENIKKQSGSVVLNLSEGESPYGYYYNPDYFFITEWNNESDFDQFMKENQLDEKQSLKHINQFKLRIN